jgi:hypothetical protein
MYIKVNVNVNHLIVLYFKGERHVDFENVESTCLSLPRECGIDMTFIAKRMWNRHAFHCQENVESTCLSLPREYILLAMKGMSIPHSLGNAQFRQ